MEVMPRKDRRPSLFPLATTLLLAAAVTVSFAGCAADAGVPEGERTAPSLVVMVVVDQLRADLLDRYDHLFEHGLRRLQDEGFHFREATFDHAITATAPGHATASTGVHPNRHGLVVNTWRSDDGEEGWRSVYAVLDEEVEILGSPELPGRSPVNMEATGLPDWFAGAAPEATTVSVSRKDRAAVAMGGFASEHVYWLLPEEGRFSTSTYYRTELADWVEELNRRGWVRAETDSIWTSRVPPEAEHLTRPDTAAFEGDGVNTWFPHRFHQEVEPGPTADPQEMLASWVAETPAPDAWTVELAVQAIRNLGLGTGSETDYLAVGLSQVDRVGHEYGPLSREQLDNLLHLDREFGALLDALDQEVGVGRWVLAFTGDHGVLEIPEYREEAVGIAARRLSPEDEAALVAAAEEAAEAAGTDPEARAEAAAIAAEGFTWVEAAYPLHTLDLHAADSFVVFQARSSFEGRVPAPLGHLGVAIRRTEDAYLGRYPRGTGHGSPYLFDRRVPLSFIGSGIPAGSSDERVSIVDLAPTLAVLAGIAPPSGLDGRDLSGRLHD